MRKPLGFKPRFQTRHAKALARVGAWLLCLTTAAAAANPPRTLSHWWLMSDTAVETQDATNEARRPAAVATPEGHDPGNGQGRLFDEASSKPMVVPATTATGEIRFDPGQGAIRLVFQPEWSSRQAIVLPGDLPGEGPGRLARLWQIGDWTADASRACLTLAFDPGGTNLLVLTQNGRGSTSTNLVAGFSSRRLRPMPGRTLPPPRWHEVAVNYGSARIELILDGSRLQDVRNRMPYGPGVAGLPSDARLAIGSAAEGTGASGCWIQEVQTYSAPISPLELNSSRSSMDLGARVETSPPAVTLSWRATPGNPLPVKRRLRGEEAWRELGRTADGSWHDVDPALQPGAIYEYLVGLGNWICVPLAARPVEQRGHVLLLVDKTLERDLRAELARFEQDLRGDGWMVRQEEVPRHEDDFWRRDPVNRDYLKDLEKVKALIRREHASVPGGLQSVVLVGHVTIPYSGATAEDGHPEHLGAWPADAWYGDLDGNWTDHVITTPAHVRNATLRNVRKDGKWDAHRFNANIAPSGVEHGVEIAVGRIDFANLPAFRGQSEAELLRRYFAKNHRYRHGQLTFAPSVAGGAFFWSRFSQTGQSIYQQATLCASRLWPRGADAAFFADAFGGGIDSLWAMQGGYGGADALHNSRDANKVHGTDRYSTAWLAAHESQPQSGFYLLMGSYFGDWNLAKDNFLRGCVALPDAGLAALWIHHQRWAFEPLGAGEPLGSVFVETARGRASTRTTFIIGDPTLRMQVTPPPTNLTAERQGRQEVALSWTASPEAGARYAVYRISKDEDAYPQRLNATPLTEPRFLDPAAERGRQSYAVRTLVPVTTGSGTFTNLSQAAFVELR
jgi:hypothetical protein